MSTSTVQPPLQASARPSLDLPEEDGVPLESDWHRLTMNLLIEVVTRHNKGREDYFVGGNMFIYFNADREVDKDIRGPDFFYVADVPLNPPRHSWVVWLEGDKFPDVIIELASPSTAALDRGIKKDVYERTFQTHEYFIYDPDSEKLQGWRLGKNHRYRPIKPNDKGRLWCEKLGLWLGTWTGKFQDKENVYLRFFDKDGNLVPTADEWGLAEQQRAETEKQRAETEKRRAEAAEAELERLKKQLRKPVD